MSEQTETPAPAKNVGGRPNYNPTKEVREMVQAMCVASLSVSMMAKIVGIDRATFRAAFKGERKFSKKKAIATVTSRLFEHTKKSVPAAIFWLCNMDPDNWSNRHMMTHEGGDPNKPIRHQIRIIGGLPDDDGPIIDQEPQAVDVTPPVTPALIEQV